MTRPQLIDGINFLKTLSFRRAANALAVLSSYAVSRILKRPVNWGMPVSFSIEPTTSCNLRCPECPSGLRAFSRPTGMLQPELFRKVINELAPTTPYLILYFQGEPYLNPNFFQFVSHAASKRMYVATSTNGHYLTDEKARQTVESGLSRLIISIDGSTQDTYQSYRIGGKLDKVLEGARRVVEWKKKLRSRTPHIIFQFLVVRPNEHQIPEIFQLAKEIGVDEVKLKTAQVYDYENGNPLIPQDINYSRYRPDGNGKFVLKNPLLNHCWKMWQGCVFTWDGKVVPCCFDKDATHVLGDINTQSFRSLWKGAEYQKFRASLLRSRKEIDICTNCTEGGRVWA